MACDVVLNVQPHVAVLPSEFPIYTRRARIADGLVHVIGVPLAVAAATGLLARVAQDGTARQLAAACVYCMGLVGMLSASAAYNLVWPGRLKLILRRLDHAMIFVMIAGSYTPFALCALGPDLGGPLLAASWAVAVVGSTLKVLLGNRYRPAFLALYLAHGWMLLVVIRPVAAALSRETMLLMLAGGVVYSLGAWIHTRERWTFHNAIWHVMVLAAAGLQLCGIALVLGVVL